MSIAISMYASKIDMNDYKRIVVVLVSLLLLTTALAGDYEDGWLSYRKNDYEKAMSKFKASASSGKAEAYSAIAFMYENGFGVLQDYKEAAKWHRIAASKGDTQSQSALALMYENGAGVERSVVLAHMWYNIAASKGDGYFVNNRITLESKMTIEQINAAQRKARECMASNFTKCD